MRLVRTMALTSSCLGRDGRQGLNSQHPSIQAGVGFGRSPHSEPPDIETQLLVKLVLGALFTSVDGRKRLQ